MMDYISKPMGKSLVKDPRLWTSSKGQMASADNSPVLARAPILLSESLSLPYRKASVRAGYLDGPGPGQQHFCRRSRPSPDIFLEIINPRESSATASRPSTAPNVHPLVDPLIQSHTNTARWASSISIPSLRSLAETPPHRPSPAWDRWHLWAGQRKDATSPADQASTASLALFYLAVGRTTPPPRLHRALRKGAGLKYSGLQPDPEAGENSNPDLPARPQEQVFTTNEGPVVITNRG